MTLHECGRAGILAWLATIGAASAEQVAAACGIGPGAARAHLRALGRARLASSVRLLHGAPALHVLTAAGLRAAGRQELGPVALSAASFAHQYAVAQAAVAIVARGMPVLGERELRVLERAAGSAVASAEVGYAPDGSVALHRPDLAIPLQHGPVAVEVELTVKAPERLRRIVRGWARSRVVSGVVYYASEPAQRALAHAVRHESAGGTVVVLPLERAGQIPAFDRRVPSQALRSVAASGPTTQRRTQWQRSTA